jgi:hypothetical protein
MRRKQALGRYERDTDGRLLLDVAADKAEDLYSNFDRNAPYIRRDLDPDLTDYLIEGARDLGREPFVIRFALGQIPSEDQRSRIARSINNYFLYMAASQRTKIRQLIGRSMILMTIGIGVLFASVWANSRIGPDSAVAATVFAQGLTVAAWVSLWEALATFLVDWLPHLGELAIYHRVADAPIAFGEPSAGS